MLEALTAVMVFVAVASLMLGLSWRTPSALEARLRSFRSRAVTMDDEIDLSAPFSDRILRPGAEVLARAAASIMPKSVLADVQRRLTMAGNPMTVNAFVTLWLTSFVSMLGLALLMIVAVGQGVGLPQIGLLVIFGALGWMLPNTWLKGRIRARQRAILKSLPDALDWITTCVEAGLGLDAALARVTEKSSGPLSYELSRMLREVAMGKLRREALIEMAERVGLEELKSFVNAVIQAEQLGVGIAQVLRVQSEQMRTRRRQRAEQAAHEAPVKMIFPLVLFIFPAFMVVILGPAVIRIGDQLIR